MFRRRDFVSRFTMHLYALYKAHIPLLECIMLLYDMHQSKKEKQYLASLALQLQAGVALSAACAQLEGVFSQSYCQMIKMAEQTGDLLQVLKALDQQQQQQQFLEKKIQSALRYPLFMLALSMIMLAVMVRIMVPVFSQLLLTNQLDLPAITQFLIVVYHQGLYWLLGFAGLLGILCFSMKRYAWHQPYWDQLIFHLPGIASLLRLYYQVETAKCIALSQQAKLPFLQGLEHARAQFGHRQIVSALEEIIAQLSYGAGLLASFSGQEHIFEAPFMKMLLLSEATGRLAEHMDYYAKTYQAYFYERLSKLQALMHPFFLMVMGGVVSVMILALYAPIMQMGMAI